MIKVLDKVTADKIAAGEVIERPISIVKELVENALDSGASSVVVEIKNGGKSYIRVTDDGCGIAHDEVETAFLRHATSKISTAKDLDSIETLGFRGEALSSIAAVTHTELITKEKDKKLGTRLIIHGGNIIENTTTGCPDGTTIIVTDLFYNTPARLKFLKSDAAESSQIIEFMSQIALCYKDIKFRFINNGKVLFTTLGDGNRLNTIIRVFPEIEAKNLVPIDYKDFDESRQSNESKQSKEAKQSNESILKIEGYISTPAMSRNTRSGEIFFVNGRVVNSKVIEKGITLGYKERLFEGRFPICFLFLSSDPSKLDVNIHPNKREVRFDNEAAVSEFVGRAIINTLKSNDAVVNMGNIFDSQSKKEKSENIFKKILEPLREKSDINDKKMDSIVSDNKSLFNSENDLVLEQEKAPFLSNDKSSVYNDEKNEQLDIKSFLSTNYKGETRYNTNNSKRNETIISEKNERNVTNNSKRNKNIISNGNDINDINDINNFNMNVNNISNISEINNSDSNDINSSNRNEIDNTYRNQNGSKQENIPCSSDNLKAESDVKKEKINIYEPMLKPFDFEDLKVTGVLFDTYITCVDDNNFYLFDQHAAHERIFYEELVGQYDNVDKYSQPLLIPSLFNVSLSADNEKSNWLEPLTRMGFVITEFGPQTYRIEEIPMFMELEEAETFVNNFIDGISTSTDLRNTVVINKLIMMSCKSAVKANDILKPEEIKALIDRLSQCRNPFSCPHGRPTFVKMSRYEIEKLFKRVQ